MRYRRRVLRKIIAVRPEQIVRVFRIWRGCFEILMEIFKIIRTLCGRCQSFQVRFICCTNCRGFGVAEPILCGGTCRGGR